MLSPYSELFLCLIFEILFLILLKLATLSHPPLDALRYRIIVQLMAALYSSSIVIQFPDCDPSVQRAKFLSYSFLPRQT